MSTIIFAVIVLLVIMQTVTPPESLPNIVEIVLGAFASVIVQFLKGKFQSVTSRFVLAVALAIVSGVISYAIAKPEQTNFVVFVVHVFAYSQIVYAAFWKVIWEDVLKLSKIGARK